MLYMGDNLHVFDGVHPQVWLHDCLFSVRTEEGALVFEFPEGFKYKIGDKCYRSKRGMIRMINHPAHGDADDLNIMAFKTKWKRGRYHKWGHSLTVTELIELLDGGCLENFHERYDEYTVGRGFLWRCSTRFAKKPHRMLGGEIELEAFFDKLEYYRSQEDEPYEA